MPAPADALPGVRPAYGEDMDEAKPDDWMRIHLASGAHIDSRDSITEFHKRLAGGFAIRMTCQDGCISSTPLRSHT